MMNSEDESLSSYQFCMSSRMVMQGNKAIVISYLHGKNLM